MIVDEIRYKHSHKTLESSMIQIEKNMTIIKASLRLAASIANAGNPIPFMRLWRSISESGDFELIGSIHKTFKHDLVSILCTNRPVNFDDLETFDLSDATLFAKVLDAIAKPKKN